MMAGLLAHPGLPRPFMLIGFQAVAEHRLGFGTSPAPHGRPSDT
jgi:hypothetical protein